MIIRLVCDNKESWINPYIYQFKKQFEHRFEITVHHDYDFTSEADYTFFLSCENKISSNVLSNSTYNYLIHESDLPAGKGWSPVTWQILEGKKEIVVSLIEVNSSIDSGDILLQNVMKLNGSELINEIRDVQWQKSKELILEVLNSHKSIIPTKQVGQSTYYPRRTPADSELNISKSIDDQFNLLRVVDNDRYPAHFYKNGVKYILKIFKSEE